MPERPISYSPFFAPPPPDDLRSRTARIVDAAVSRPRAEALVQPRLSAFQGQGPLMSLADRAALAAAPKLTPALFASCPPSLGFDNATEQGTTVTVRKYPIGITGGRADHMYVQFDDGRRSMIARGGPNFAGVFPRVTAEVADSHDSRDYGRGGQTVFQGYLPKMNTTQAAQGAARHAAEVRRGGYGYNADSNSNSYAADVIEDLFGCRPGDNRTWGYRNRVKDQPPFVPAEF